MDGILVIDKPCGMTSHDVVAIVKRRLRAQRVGHLGTLDPNATGVLPLVINRATKSARFLEGGIKGYSATAKLGEETDTFDVDGTVTESRSTEDVTPEAIKSVLASFIGKISQLPPMYSAVKRKGVPLYKLARKGIVVEREPKDVEIFSVDVEEIDLPLLRFSVTCSRGTYIRTLCHDMGITLGCGAHLTGLKRTISGAFTIEDAISLDSSPEDMKAAIISVEYGINKSFKGLQITSSEAERIQKGATLLGIEESASLSESEMVRFVYSNRLVALAEFKGEGIFKIVKSFHSTQRQKINKVFAVQ